MVRLAKVLLTLLFMCVLWGSDSFQVLAAQDPKVQKVALVMKALSNPFFIKLDNGAREYAKKNQIPLEVFGLDRETDVEQQISIIENLIARNIGAIVIAPSDSRKLIPVCIEAINRGISVINIDNPLDHEILKEHNVTIPFIGPDNVQGGKLIGKYISKRLGGKGRVLLVEGIPGAFNSDGRKEGFIEGVTDQSEIEIVDVLKGNWHSDEALSVVVSALEKYGPVDAILCANDVMAQGALQALDLYGLSSKTLVAGYDNIDPVWDEILNNRIHATIEQHPAMMGAEGVEAAWWALQQNETVSSRKTPVQLITQEPIGKNVVFSVSTLLNPFFAIMVENAKNEASLYGMNFTVLDANDEEAKQLVEVMDAISKKPDLIIVNPTNSAVLYPAIEAATLSGIPVISVDRRMDEASILTNISSDNRMGGQLAASFLVKKLDGKGTLLELEGIPGTSAAHERGAGFNEEIQKHEGIKISYREVANFDRMPARQVVSKLIEQGMTIEGAFAHNDNMILGLIDAYEEAGVQLPEVIVGFDGDKLAIHAIKESKLTATIAQRPDLMGRLAVDAAASFFRGEPIPKETLVKLELIDN